MSIHRAIGIDLGTTNSAMAYMPRGEPKIILNGRGRPLTPSAVSVRRGELLVGQSAKNRAYDPNTILSIKRFIGLPFDLVREETLTCYQGIKGAGCGECPACKLRNRGLHSYLADRKL